MKRFYQISIILLLVVFTILTSCKKQSEAVIDSQDSELNSLADQVIANMDLQEVYSGNPDMAIYMKNDGISADLLVEETDLDGKDTLRKPICDFSFIACLRGLSLNEKQVSGIKRDIKVYRECRENAMQRAKAIYRDLHEKYKTKYNRIYTAFQDGTISREKYKTLVAELCIEFRKELRSLHLKERLDDVFKGCFRTFLKDLHSILTERQWNAFVECYKRLGL
jgi:hypothetical protein